MLRKERRLPSHDAAWLLIVGGIASFVLAGLPIAVGALMIAAAYIWIGYILWTEGREVVPAMQPRPAL
jgi:hypothetical protein